MIPSSRTLEIARSEVDEMIAESQADSEEEEPYFEYTWFGLTYSYSKAGYWGRIMLVILLFIPLIAALAVEGEGGMAFLMMLFLAGAIGLSLLGLGAYRR